jgi:hypothetical protein
MWFSVCTQLSGTYTVGSSSSDDFNTISDAAASLLQCGLAGPVVFEIDPNSGPYVEQVKITGPITGLSATNTVTFSGNGASVEWASTSSDPSIIELDDVNHIIIDSLNIISTDAIYGWGVHFTHGADSNTIQNCSIVVPQSTTTLSLPIVFSASPTSYSSVEVGGAGNYNSIDNNYLFGGYFGISMYASSTTYSNTGNSFTNNMIDGFYAYGGYFRYALGTKFNYNDVSRLNSATVTTFYGAYVYYCYDDVQIIGNRIHDAFAVGSSTAYGIYMYNCDGTSSNNNVVENNIIYNMSGSTSTLYAIYSYSNDYTNFNHNTVDITDPNATGGTVYGIFFSSTHSNSSAQNNIINLVKGGTSSKYNLYFSSTQSTFTCDYNALYNDTLSTSSYIAYYSGTQTELSNWQTVASGIYAQNSVQENPVFANASGGDLTRCPSWSITSEHRSEC